MSRVAASGQDNRVTVTFSGCSREVLHQDDPNADLSSFVLVATLFSEAALRDIEVRPITDVSTFYLGIQYIAEKRLPNNRPAIPTGRTVTGDDQRYLVAPKCSDPEVDQISGSKPLDDGERDGGSCQDRGKAQHCSRQVYVGSQVEAQRGEHSGPLSLSDAPRQHVNHVWSRDE